MHGRLKVRTDSEKAEAERKSNEAKAAKFRAGSATVFQMRNDPEMDDAALSLTSSLLLANPDFYTLWNYRREILSRRKDRVIENEGAGDGTGDSGKISHSDYDAMCKDELELSASCLLKNPKSYPSWHHRCWCINQMYKPDFESEIQLCNSALHRDSRNFHCWNYRRFLFTLASIEITREIEFTESKIRENFSNFSSWYLRSTLLTEAAEMGILDLRREWDKEYASVENAIFTDPTDQSAWFYHKWLSSINLGESISGRRQLHTGIAVKQIVWNKIHRFLVIRFNRSFHVCPDLLITFTGNRSASNSSLHRLSDNHLQSAFVLMNLDPTIESLSIVFDNSILQVRGTSDIIVLNSESGSFQVKRMLKDDNVANLKELHELEPENKWTNLALTFFGSDRVATLRKLCDIDSCRTNYYRDLASDICTDKLLTQSASSCSLNLRSQQLTRLSHSERMAHIRFLDLSENNLDILSCSFNDLYSLETLVLSDNRISAISRGLRLMSLRYLSLIGNEIASVQVLDRLSHCLNLRVIYLSGNPCSATVRDHLSSLWNFDEAAPNLQTFEGSASIAPLQLEARA